MELQVYFSFSQFKHVTEKALATLIYFRSRREIQAQYFTSF